MPASSRLDTGLTSLLLASFVGSIAMFGSASWKPSSLLPPLSETIKAGNDINNNQHQVVGSLLAMWPNKYDETCFRRMQGDSLAAATQGSCTRCKFGCAKAGSCATSKPDTTGGCPKPTQEQKDTNAASLEAKQAIPRDGEFAGFPISKNFLGQEWWGYGMNNDAMIGYFIGLYMVAISALGVSILSCFGLCFFCAFRCPCGAEYNSGDTCCSCLFKSFGTNMYCPILPGDNPLVMLLKCIICPGCPNPFFCCLCCCRAKVVSATLDGQTSIFSGGLLAKGDPNYAANYAGRTEPMSCCGGVYPSTQYGSCGCGEWGCCCDCACGLCECCNPCCRTNLFDYERSAGGAPGYSLYQGRLLTLVFIGIVILFITAMSITIAGKDAFLCGVDAFMPSLVNVFDGLITYIVDLTGAIMNLAVTLDEVLNMSGFNVASVGDAVLIGLSAAVEVAFDLKSSICELDGGGGIFNMVFGIIVDFVCYIGFGVLAVGLVGFLHFMLPVSVARLTLVAGCLAIVAGFLAMVLYIVVDPLALMLSDLCVLFDNIKSKGAMYGFPNESPPDFCGAKGPMAAFPLQISKIGTMTQQYHCQAYSELCNTENMPGGVAGGTKTVSCPDALATDSFEFFFDNEAVPLVLPRLKFDHCVSAGLLEVQTAGPLGPNSVEPKGVEKFYRDFNTQKADTTTLINNVRYGCPKETITSGTTPQIVNFNFAETKTCDMSFNPFAFTGIATPDAKWCKSHEARGGVCTEKTGVAMCASESLRSGVNNKVRYCFGGPTGAATGAGPLASAQPDAAKMTMIRISKDNLKFSVVSEIGAATPAGNGATTTTITWVDTSASSAAACRAAATGSGGFSKGNVVQSNSLGSLGTTKYIAVPQENTYWSTVDSKYSVTSTDGGTCSYTCDTTMIEAGQCNIGCSLTEQQPVMCESTAVTVKECADTIMNENKMPTPNKGVDTAGQKVCDSRLLQMKALGLYGFFNVISQVVDLNVHYNKGPTSADNKPTCDGIEDEVKLTSCKAGRAMSSIVNCGFLEILATETYDAVCSKMAGGLMAIGSGLMTFFFGYMLAFLTFILGYKRWNRKYQEGYAVDAETDDSEKPPVKGLLGIICGNLSPGGSHTPVAGDTLVFGTGKSSSGQAFTRVVEEEMCVKKGGWALVDPMEGKHMAGFEPPTRAGADQKELASAGAD